MKQGMTPGLRTVLAFLAIQGLSGGVVMRAEADSAAATGGAAPSSDSREECAAVKAWAGKAFSMGPSLPSGSVAGHPGRLPFSFVYGGKPSAELLPSWARREKTEQAPDGTERRTIVFTDPSTGLEMTVEITRFADLPGIDWVLHFANRGRTDSALLEQIQPLNLAIDIPDGAVMFHHAYGSTASATDFIPIDEPLAPGAVVNLAPVGGRSSNGVLPFFNLEWPRGGMAWAVGWSGQWSQRLQRIDAATIGIEAGQQHLRARLHPGEGIRTPRILLAPWRGTDADRGPNQLRRLLLAHYVPRRDGRIAIPPVTQNSWFVYSDGNGTTEENQIGHIRALPSLGVEAWWLDAGWFEGGWPNGVGSWVPNAAHFPHGLKPLGDEAHRLGLKFLVWFEPERVDPNSLIAREHPGYVLGMHTGWNGSGLFNLGDPSARVWLTDLLSRCIGDWGIVIYRTDFNVGSPLRFWEAADTPGREGITENHYVEGL